MNLGEMIDAVGKENVRENIANASHHFAAIEAARRVAEIELTNALHDLDVCLQTRGSELNGRYFRVAQA